MLGGITLGIHGNYGVAYISSSFKDAIAFGILFWC
jgi:hypothetical protein